MYGRRRLGKSALVREAIRDHEKTVDWQATEETADAQLANFVETASETFPLFADIQRDWEALLRALGREDAVVILDEFPYLIGSNEALPSKIQRVWDLHLQESELTLVLVGSLISIMEDKVLGSGSPLYGRRTGTIDLPPLALADAKQLYPTNDPDSVFQSWGVFGGTPFYLQALTPSTSLAENIDSHLLSEHGVLHNEPEFLLRTEFGIHEPQTYYTILRAIATGKRAANEIADFAGVDSNTLGSYLSKLRRIRLIERDIPLTANPNATRKSRYRLKEPLFRFWFRYVYGQDDKLAQTEDNAYEQLVTPTFTEYMAPMFEQICQNALQSLVPHIYNGIGYWWHQHHELDVVGLADDGTLVAGECKYTTRKMTEGDLADLERAVKHIQWSPQQRLTATTTTAVSAAPGSQLTSNRPARNRDDVSLFTSDDILNALTPPQAN